MTPGRLSVLCDLTSFAPWCSSPTVVFLSGLGRDGDSRDLDYHVGVLPGDWGCGDGTAHALFIGCEFQMAVTMTSSCLPFWWRAALHVVGMHTECHFASWIFNFPIRTVMMTLKMLRCLIRKRKQLTDQKNPKSGMRINFNSCVSPVLFCP